MSLAPFPCLHCTPAHFTCVLTCVWACVPVQRMARDALCAPRVWDAAEPEVIHPRAFTDKRSLRLPSRSFGEVLLYFRPLERCERSAACFNTPVPVLRPIMIITGLRGTARTHTTHVHPRERSRSRSTSPLRLTRHGHAAGSASVQRQRGPASRSRRSASLHTGFGVHILCTSHLTLQRNELYTRS